MMATRSIREEIGWATFSRAGDKINPYDQLQPWLVPHWVQTPQAPARITLSEPQFEQVMPM
jgi:hypothetical protein